MSVVTYSTLRPSIQVLVQGQGKRRRVAPNRRARCRRSTAARCKDATDRRNSDMRLDVTQPQGFQHLHRLCALTMVGLDMGQRNAYWRRSGRWPGWAAPSGRCHSASAGHCRPWRESLTSSGFMVKAMPKARGGRVAVVAQNGNAGSFFPAVVSELSGVCGDATRGGAPFAGLQQPPLPLAQFQVAVRAPTNRGRRRSPAARRRSGTLA